MISNNSSGNSTNNAVVGGGSGGVNNLRDICNFLQTPIMNPAALPPGVSPYDHIIDMIRGLDLQDDGIVMNRKIKSIETDFCNIVRDENMLCESMEYINAIALADGDTSLKFALLFSSRNFDALAMKDTKVRSAMLKILETNFLNADTYRLQDKDRLYNSITLLGEYYHRVRLADNTPITILGESLLGLLVREISALEPIDTKLAKLILSQITLNGDIMRVKHKAELTLLLYHIRRNLIEQASLKATVKALLLMTLDLYYSNFANLGTQLEEMYTKYLVLEDDDEGNNNLYAQQHPHNQQQQQPQAVYQSPTQLHLQQIQVLHPQQPLPANFASQDPNVYPDTQHNSHFENGSERSLDATVINDVYEPQPTTKKWSEQVCEDSMLENELGNDVNGDSGLNVSGGDGSFGDNQQQHSNSSYEWQAHASNSRRYGDGERHTSGHNSKRSYHAGHSPRPLKQNYNSSERTDGQNKQQDQQQQQSGGEERDETKPLPRWRAPRFNRDSAEQQNNHPHNQQRRYSTSFEDDGQSVRSEGGSIRLYSVNDRLKHSQEKIATNNSNFNYIANSNWDHQSQRDDRSERSYISNYEMGNYRSRRGGRGQSHRQTYDKPPRFQKHQQQQHQQQQHQQQHQHQHNKDNNKIHSDSWRRSQHTNANSNSNYQDENSSSRYNGHADESNDRSTSRARTLPRPAKSNWGADGANASSYRRSQSPGHSGQQYQGGPRARHYNARYSSQSSLASEASSTLERRHNNNHHQRNRTYSRRPQQHQQPQDWVDAQAGQPAEAGDGRAESWDAKDNNSELVRNAQQTTKYMNYLSSKK